MFFSDAVFAIAITLLVVEIGVPHIHDGPHGEIASLQALADRIPEFSGFFVSFLVIGAFWANHHRAFGLVDAHDGSFVWPNLHLLLAIAFLPFSTAFMSDNIQYAVPNIFYALSLLAAGLLQLRLFHRVLRPRFAADGVTDEQMAAIKRRSWSVPIASLIALLVSAIYPTVATLAFVTMPILIRLLSRPRGTRRAA